jgi:hypothetical protein
MRQRFIILGLAAVVVAAGAGMAAGAIHSRKPPADAISLAKAADCPTSAPGFRRPAPPVCTLPMSMGRTRYETVSELPCGWRRASVDVPLRAYGYRFTTAELATYNAVFTGPGVATDDGTSIYFVPAGWTAFARISTFGRGCRMVRSDPAWKPGDYESLQRRARWKDIPLR